MDGDPWQGLQEDLQQQDEMINGNPAPIKPGFIKEKTSWDLQQATTAAETTNECQAVRLSGAATA